MGIATGGFWPAFLAVSLFTATMGTLMLTVSVLVGLSKNTAIRRMKASSRPIQRVASGLMVLVGAGLIASAAWTDAFQTIFPA